MTAERFSLEGKVAIVVGGGGALGRAFCLGLGDAGAAVAVVDISPQRSCAVSLELQQAGINAIDIVADACDVGQLEAASKLVGRRFGGIDVLINAAGMADTIDFFTIADPDWYRILDINLTAVFHACQVFGKAMKQAGRGGSIINISSASSDPPLSQVLVYGVAKAGVNNLTQYLARELAPDNIRVNAVAPGFFPTAQNKRILSEQRVAAIMDHTPAKRLGEPDDLVGAVIWLASDAASRYVTGAIIRVDGGFSAMTI